MTYDFSIMTIAELECFKKVVETELKTRKEERFDELVLQACGVLNTIRKEYPTARFFVFDENIRCRLCDSYFEDCIDVLSSEIAPDAFGWE